MADGTVIPQHEFSPREEKAQRDARRRLAIGLTPQRSKGGNLHYRDTNLGDPGMGRVISGTRPYKVPQTEQEKQDDIKAHQSEGAIHSEPFPGIHDTVSDAIAKQRPSIGDRVKNAFSDIGERAKATAEDIGEGAKNVGTAIATTARKAADRLPKTFPDPREPSDEPAATFSQRFGGDRADTIGD